MPINFWQQQINGKQQSFQYGRLFGKIVLLKSSGSFSINLTRSENGNFPSHFIVIWHFLN